jgi:hypothetical protein
VEIEAEYEEVAETESELDLSADDSLPWLEAEEDESAGGVDTAQVIIFALILLDILVAVVGAVWYFGSRSGDAAQVADGSIIQAPEGPYKERPDDPGGKEFEGTGNVAPVVGEGGAPEGVMATDGEREAGMDEEAEPEAPAPAPAAAPPRSGVGVQLAAYSSRARAEQGWADLTRRTDALSGMRYRIEEGVVDIGTVYRLQAVAADRASADRLCAALKADGVDCQVKP